MRSLLDGFFTAQDFSYDPDDKRFPMSLTCDHPERPNEKMHFVPTEYAAEVAADVGWSTHSGRLELLATPLD